MEQILVTGANGFFGTAVCRKLEARGLPYVATSRRAGVDLEDRGATLELFREVRPDVVLNCAARTGGILYSVNFPADVFVSNMRMALNLLEGARDAGVRRFVNPISSCSYPASATLYREDEWWDGPLHDTVLAYGFARKASWVGSWAYARQFGLDTFNLVLSNMYGPGDHFDEERSHALGALIMKFARAKQLGEPHVVVWGSGTAVREWLHVDDGAEAMVRAIAAQSSVEPVNVGVASGVSVIELATTIRDIIGYEGEIVLDRSKPDGAPYKTVDGTRGEALLGWGPETDLVEGVRQTAEWYLSTVPATVAR